jgi:uncharacterized damage-inducible protein DinB
MTVNELNTWLDYHFWARDLIFDAVSVLTPEQFTRPIESSFKSVRDTVAHIYFADWVWYMRWTDQLPATPPANDSWPDVASLRKASRELEEKIRAFVNEGGEPGLERVYHYKSLTGQPAASPFWQMLVHIVNHGSYHRGQVTTLLRQLGAPPPKQVDMIAFFRTRQASVSEPADVASALRRTSG